MKTPKNHLQWLLFLLLIAVLMPVQAQRHSLVAAQAEVTQVAGDFGFLEGPVSDFDGNLYFTDIDNNRIHRLSTAGEISIVREPSHHANGLTLDVDQGLLICEQSAQRLAKLDPQGNYSIVVESYDGSPFNSPNDVWLHRNGSLYFTDPRYRYPEGEPSQPGEYVYRLSPDRETVEAVLTDIPKPNGIIGTEDGAHLYVASTELRKVFRYDLDKNGLPVNRIEFADQGSDGMTMDERGNVYLTWAGRVSIYSPAGELLTEIEVPENPANVGFGGTDGRTLFITARTGLYSLRMNVVSSRYAYEMRDFRRRQL